MAQLQGRDDGGDWKGGKRAEKLFGIMICVQRFCGKFTMQTVPPECRTEKLRSENG